MSSQSSEEGKHKLLEHNRVSATVRAESSWTEEKESSWTEEKEQLDRGERESSWTEEKERAAGQRRKREQLDRERS